MAIVIYTYRDPYSLDKEPFWEEICEEINDEKLTVLLQKVDFRSEDLGVYQIKVIVSYICSNYQVESKRFTLGSGAIQLDI